MIHKAAGQGLTIHVKGLAFCAMHKRSSCICEPIHTMAGQGPGTPAAGSLYAPGCPRMSLGDRTATPFAESPAPASDDGSDERPKTAEQRASLRRAAAVQYQQQPDSSVMNEFARHEQQRRYAGLLASGYGAVLIRGRVPVVPQRNTAVRLARTFATMHCDIKQWLSWELAGWRPARYRRGCNDRIPSGWPGTLLLQGD